MTYHSYPTKTSNLEATRNKVIANELSCSLFGSNMGTVLFVVPVLMVAVVVVVGAHWQTVFMACHCYK